MDQRLAALAEDLGSILRTYKVAQKHSQLRFQFQFWLCGHQTYICAYVHMQMNTLSSKINKVRRLKYQEKFQMGKRLTLHQRRCTDLN